MAKPDEEIPQQQGKTDGGVGYRCPPAATRFKPGRSGNPGGRPKGPSLLAVILRRLREKGEHGTLLDDAAKAYVDQLLAGSLPHAKLIIELEHRAGAEPVRIEVVWKNHGGRDRGEAQTGD